MDENHNDTGRIGPDDMPDADAMLPVPAGPAPDAENLPPAVIDEPGGQDGGKVRGWLRRLARVLKTIGTICIVLFLLVIATPFILTAIRYPEIKIDLSEQLKDTPEGLFPDKTVRVRFSLKSGRLRDYEVQANGTLLGWPFSADATVNLSFRFFGFSADGDARFRLNGTSLGMKAEFEADSSGEWRASAEMPKTTLNERDPYIALLLSRMKMPGVTDLVFGGTLSFSASAEQTEKVPVPKWTVSGRLQDFGATLKANGQPITITNLRSPFGASGLADHTDISPIFLRADKVDAAGFTLTDVFASLRPTERAVLITEAGAGFCGGELKLYSLFLDMKRLNAGLTLFVDGIDAGETLQHIRGFQGEASGRLHGKIPIRIVNGRELRLQDAYLHSVPGEIGRLRLYDSTPITENLAMTGVVEEERENLARALANLDYTVLKLALRPEADDHMAFEVKLEGSATHGDATVPVSFTVTFHGEIEQLVNTCLKTATRNNKK